MKIPRADRVPDATSPGRRWSARDTAGVVIIAVFVLWGAVAGLATASGGSAPRTDVGVLLACGAFLGSALLLLGAPHRRGDSLHCVHCEHEAPPTARAAPRCPECGADLRPHGATARGRRRATPWLCTTGGGMLALVVATLLLQVVDRAAPGLRWRYAPLVLVVRDLRDPATVVPDDAWDALSSRALEPADRRRVVAALLDRRVAGGSVPGAGAWIDRELTAAPDPALLDRLHFEGFAWEAATSRRVRAGDDLRVTVRGRTARWGAPDTWVGVRLVRAWFDGETTNRLDAAVHALGDPGDGPDRPLVGARIDVPTTGLEPGRRTLHLEFLLAAGPRRVDPARLFAGGGPGGANRSASRVVDRPVTIE